MITQVYKDISREFRFDHNGKVEISYGVSVINDAIRTILSTTKGERIMNVDFGSNIKSYLFEDISISTANKIKIEVDTTIKKYEDRIEIVGVEVDARVNQNTYNIDVFYYIIATNERGQFSGRIKKL